jgi:MOSC domain-containing protein YiiM
VLAVCAGRVAPLAVGAPGLAGERELVASAIDKRAVSRLEDARVVPVAAMGIEGDEQADRTVHGGLDQAVYVYPHEHYAFWRTVRSQAKVDGALEPGAMGENLLVEGLLEPAVFVGDRLVIGEVELRVERPRSPCFKFNARMGFGQAVKLMVQSGYTGFYCSVVRQGRLAAGDSILVRPGERVASIDQAHRLQHRSRREPFS